MICDSLGRPLRFKLTAGQRHDNLAAKDLLAGFQAQAVLADRSSRNLYSLRQQRPAPDHRRDGRRGRHPLDAIAQAPDPARRSRLQLRNRIERCFNKLKHFRRFATRYDRRAELYLAFVHIAAIALWLR